MICLERLHHRSVELSQAGKKWKSVEHWVVAQASPRGFCATQCHCQRIICLPKVDASRWSCTECSGAPRANQLLPTQTLISKQCDISSIWGSWTGCCLKWMPLARQKYRQIIRHQRENPRYLPLTIMRPKDYKKPG